MSNWKLTVRGIELFAILTAICAVVSGTLVFFGRLNPSQLEVYAFVAFAPMFFCFGAALILVAEFSKATREGQALLRRSAGLLLDDLKRLTQWCPRWLLIGTLTLLAVSLAVSFSVGNVEWHSGQPYTGREALATTFGLANFVLLSVPVFASASRMPGSFAEQAALGKHGI